MAQARLREDQAQLTVASLAAPNCVVWRGGLLAWSLRALCLFLDLHRDSHRVKGKRFYLVEDDMRDRSLRDRRRKITDSHNCQHYGDNGQHNLGIAVGHFALPSRLLKKVGRGLAG